MIMNQIECKFDNNTIATFEQGSAYRSVYKVIPRTSLFSCLQPDDGLKDEKARETSARCLKQVLDPFDLIDDWKKVCELYVQTFSRYVSVIHDGVKYVFCPETQRDGDSKHLLYRNGQFCELDLQLAQLTPACRDCGSFLKGKIFETNLVFFPSYKKHVQTETYPSCYSCYMN